MQAPHLCVVKDGLFWCPRHEGAPPAPFLGRVPTDAGFLCGRCDEEIRRNFSRILDRITDSVGLADGFNPDEAARGTHCALVLTTDAKSFVVFEPGELVDVHRSPWGAIVGGSVMRALDGEEVAFNLVTKHPTHFALPNHFGVVIIGEHPVPR